MPPDIDEELRPLVELARDLVADGYATRHERPIIAVLISPQRAPVFLLRGSEADGTSVRRIIRQSLLCCAHRRAPLRP
jgi:hypothetical protein